MKKLTTYFVLVLFILISILSAQGFGIKGGVNLGKFTGDDISDITDNGVLDEKYLIGYTGGVFFSLPIDPLDIRVEALYSQNGAKYESTQEGADGAISIKMNWIDVPVLIGFNLGGFRIFAGPYFDFFISGTSKYEFTWEDQTIEEEDDIEKEDIKSLLYGVVGGASIGFTDNIELEVRYSMGLNNFDKEPDDWDASYGKYKESDLKPTSIQAFLNFYLTK